METSGRNNPPKNQYSFINTYQEIILSQEEALELANELKAELEMGKVPKADEDRIALMIAGLGDSRGLLRRAFAESLGRVGPAATKPLREALLNSPNVVLRRAAAKTLKLVGDPSSLPDLLEALINDEDPVVQGSSAGAIAIFGDKAVELLMTVLVNPKTSALQQGLASWALAFVGAEAPNAIRKAAKSKHSLIRAAAISALGDQIHCLGDETAIKLVIEALSDPESNVRAEATSLIGEMNKPSFIQKYLIPKLNDIDPQVRKNAALALMKLKEVKYLAKIRALHFNEKDESVRKVLGLVMNELVNFQKSKNN